MAPPETRGEEPLLKKYRIDFALIVITGNRTRYVTMRPLVEADPEVESRWYPIRTWVDGDWLRFLPWSARIRARHFLDSWRLLVRPPADAVVIHAFETYTIYGFLHWLLRLPPALVTHFDGGLKNIPRPGRGPWGWMKRKALERTDLFIPWSNYAAAEARDHYPASAERTLILAPGHDLERFPPRPDRDPGPRFRLLFIGGDIVRKGLETLLDAYEGWLQDTCDLRVVTFSEHLTPEVSARVAALPYAELVCDVPLDELRHQYEWGDVFTFPTNDEGFPYVTLEAMAIGLPVITTPTAGIPDQIQDGETGLLVPRRDPERLAAAVNRLREDDGLRRRIIEQARAHVREHYDVRVNTERLLAAVKSLIDARRPADRSQRGRD